MSENASGRFETLRRVPNILVTEEDKRLRTLDDVFVDLNVKLTDKDDLRLQVLSRIRRRLHGRVDAEAAKSLISEMASVFGPLRSYSVRAVTEKPSDQTLLNLMFQCVDQKRLPSKYERDPDKKWAAVLPLVPVEITVSSREGKNVFHAFLASDSDRKYAEWHAPARFVKTEHKFWDFRTFLAVEILSAQTLRFATTHPAAPEFGQAVADSMVAVYGFSYRNDGKTLRFSTSPAYVATSLPLSEFSVIPPSLGESGKCVFVNTELPETAMFSHYLREPGISLLEAAGFGYAKDAKEWISNKSVPEPEAEKIRAFHKEAAVRFSQWLSKRGVPVIAVSKNGSSIRALDGISDVLSRAFYYPAQSMTAERFNNMVSDGSVYANSLKKTLAEMGVTDFASFMGKYQEVELAKNISKGLSRVAVQGSQVPPVGMRLASYREPAELLSKPSLLVGSTAERHLHDAYLDAFVRYGISEIQTAWDELRDIGERARSHEDTKAFRDAMSSFSAKKASGFSGKLTKAEKLAELATEGPMAKLFSEVELDMDTDPELYARFEKEAAEFVRAVGIAPSSKRRFKVRKLGNHKALGLYYPSQGTLVVDVSSPSSFTHEYGHMLDHAFGDLSDGRDFAPVVQRYVSKMKETLQSMPDGDKRKSRLLGDTKYNFEYYARPREIFARAFETHCRFNLGLKNSVSAKDSDYADGFEYLESEEDLRMVGAYFSKALKKGR